MGGNPKDDQQVAGETKDASNRKGLSRRGALNIIKRIGVGIGAAVVVGRDAIVAFAQQVTGVLWRRAGRRSPETRLSPQPPEIGGVIKESAKDSKPWWAPRVVPPTGAPNVLLIMTDDQGYA
jgi:hypothetical protein